MLLNLEGAVVTRSQYTNEKGKTYYGLQMSANGQSVYLNCSPTVYNQIPEILLKPGRWSLALEPQTFGNRTSFTVTGITPAGK